ncbi:hypothetical protein FQZ97_524900 [compost metagenome]
MSVGITPYSSSRGKSGARTAVPCGVSAAFALRLATAERASASACRSFCARWSTTPDRRVCTSPPPRSSADTTSPVAAFTSGGPPRKMVPWFFTMIDSSLIAGTYAPPAVHEPMTTAICGMPWALMLAWL